MGTLKHLKTTSSLPVLWNPSGNEVILFQDRSIQYTVLPFRWVERRWTYFQRSSEQNSGWSWTFRNCVSKRTSPRPETHATPLACEGIHVVEHLQTYPRIEDREDLRWGSMRRSPNRLTAFDLNRIHLRPGNKKGSWHMLAFDGTSIVVRSSHGFYLFANEVWIRWSRGEISLPTLPREFPLTWFWCLP